VFQAALVMLLLCPLSRLFARDSSDPALSAWLEAHDKLQTWSADVVQTRHLAVLTEPLVSTGRVWYSRPVLFRWELGIPPETIAVRSTNELLLVYPALKRAESYPLEQDGSGPLRDALTLMEAGFPKDEASLRKGYLRASAAKRLVTRVSLTFQTNVFNLTASEIDFADGSRLQNQFTRSVSNQPLPPVLFSTNLPTDYKRVEPFKP